MAVYVLPEGKNAAGKGKGKGKGKGGRKAKVGIAKGDEILVSYGKGFWRHRGPVDDDEGDA
jgi:hypothetical protein